MVKIHFAASSVLHGLDLELVFLSAAPNSHRLLLMLWLWISISNNITIKVWTGGFIHLLIFLFKYKNKNYFSRVLGVRGFYQDFNLGSNRSETCSDWESKLTHIQYSTYASYPHAPRHTLLVRFCQDSFHSCIVICPVFIKYTKKHFLTTAKHVIVWLCAIQKKNNIYSFLNT